MLKFKTFLLGAMLMASCKPGVIDYRYRITGTVDYQGSKQAAVWVTDTFQVVMDTCVITNSDGSQWRIPPPYEVSRVE